MPEDILIECVGVGHTYGSGRTAVVAVHGVDAVVTSRTRVAVTGPSGSGKSTLLHMMAGLVPAIGGSLTWPTWGQDPLRTAGRMGIVFQGPSLLPALDVLENVAFPLLLADVSDRVARSYATEALKTLGLSELAHQLPETLSGGQAQRVAVARVLASAPELILADEPTGQLDHQAAALVIDVLLRASEELGAALVISTHDPVIAARLPQRWTMRDGAMLLPGADRTRAQVAS
ncbi:putative ABC transport system ATP-binding protein [Nakamurella sp. UYEF19]|uniref:ABC transporter ATP-binding protein n=1 Tax=Nakamurella sp. UYEF19 TaxID=1756392 RepID=UPI003396B19A